MGFLNKTQKEKLHDFVKFVRDELDIINMPKIQLLNGRGDLKTTASYDYTKVDKIVKINAKNRATIDVMRSIAHELVHHKQYEQGRLKVKPPDIGGEIEDEANAKAGQYIKMFARKQPKIYDLDEQEEPPAPITDTATTTGTEKKGYPEVGKWESGVTRGPGNQIGNTKWSETVGDKLTRGKANKLK